MNISVRREELIEKVKKNRDEHEKIFLEAVEGYREEALKRLNEYIDEIRDGKVIRNYWQMPTPENHLEEYDRVIGLLEMGVEDVVKMSDVEYQSYVLDNWQWKKAFLMSNSYYSQTARALQGEPEDD